MKKSILSIPLVLCLSTTANACLNISGYKVIEGIKIDKVVCTDDKHTEIKTENKKVKTVVTNKEKKSEKVTIVKTYEVEKSQGIAQTLKKAHPNMSIKEANDEALKVAKDLNLTVTKTEKNEYFITVQPGFKFAKLSNGSYSKQ